MKYLLAITVFFIVLCTGCNAMAQSELATEDDKKTEVSFSVSPSPFDDQVVVNINHKNVTITSVRIFDAIMAKEIANIEVKDPSKSGTTSVVINLPQDLKPGVYFCVLYSHKNIVDTKRLLKAAL